MNQTHPRVNNRTAANTTSPGDVQGGPGRRSGPLVVLRTMATVISGVALLAGMAACGQGDTDNDNSASSPSTSSTSAAPSTSTSSSSASPSTSESSSSASSSSATPAACASSQLKLSLSQGNGGGAGSQYPYIEFTNTGDTCTIEGFPGVSFTADGQQVGASASWSSGEQRKTITLQRGGVAHAPLQIVQAHNFDEATCKPKQPDAILVYPPHQKDTISIPTSDYTACANEKIRVLSVQPVQEGK